MYNLGDTIAVEVQLKRWGNSVGVILPKRFVEEQHLKLNEKFLVEVVKEADLSDVFGSLKRKMSGQEFKDMVRKGWEK